ncbi:hypothetical protein ASPFODRAFT_56684 [Aspergillus luchuensis CBS 106.47]|uniref:Uncharacterized protein n=1 Tax=Aspergillus luchuensis (strain CBS 106.47) TaxID=1137211 RepID=A0A1M3TU06_ASPLC|nr:hypothetical protein ASPFODRAFT_56684 [Aspergillus luchuensis CBS 106.47]
MLPCFWSWNRKTTHGVTAWKTALGSEFTASCPPFASCYVLLPTLYLVPVRFPIPRLRSPTPDHLFIFWTFFLVPLLFLCAKSKTKL